MAKSLDSAQRLASARKESAREDNPEMGSAGERSGPRIMGRDRSRQAGVLWAMGLLTILRALRFLLVLPGRFLLPGLILLLATG